MKVIQKENGLPIKTWCNNPEEEAIRQAINMSMLPFAFRHIALMPDVHQGYGMPIGGVLATTNVIIPNAVGCFTGDTKVPLLNGTQKTLKELTDEGKDVYVYSLNKQREIVPGKATPKLTRQNTELIEVTVSGGEVIRCTPDHRFMMIDGTYKEAKDLKPFDSLMPLYRSYQTKDGYEYVSTTKKKGFLTHKLVAKYFYGNKQLNEIVHHKDGNWYNNNPDNLEYKDSRLHNSDHNKKKEFFKIEEFKKKRIKTLKEKGFYGKEFSQLKKDIGTKNILTYMNERYDEWKEKTKDNGKRGKKYLSAYNQSEKGRTKSKELGNKIYHCDICNINIKSPIKYFTHRKRLHQSETNNHKILFIKKLDYKEDVYCLTVEKYHNFALSAGIFVHNCDIGCGMRVFKTSLKELTKEHLKQILSLIRQRVPVGFSKHDSQQDEIFMPQLEVPNGIIKTQYINARKQVGTLGGGNHFIEIQQDEEGFIWFMIHSGSRNLGKTIADHHNNIAVELNERWFSSVPKNYQLAFLPMDSQESIDYEVDMTYAMEFAKCNRKLMADRIKESILKVIPFHVVDEFDVHHNYARLENHFGRNVLVHRKGATSARLDEIGIIPGSQGTASYIVKGLGNPESFMSCSHGAGRKMSRTKAQDNLKLEEEIKLLDEQGILHSIRNKKDLDEAPSAYKDISIVMEEQSDLVSIVHKLKPLAVIKG